MEKSKPPAVKQEAVSEPPAKVCMLLLEGNLFNFDGYFSLFQPGFPGSERSSHAVAP